MTEHQSAFFRSRRLALPQTYTLDKGERAVGAYLLKSEISEVYRLICQAAEVGLNVGWDEYPTEHHFHQLIYRSEVFTFRSLANGVKNTDLKAAVVVEPYWMCGEDPCVACLWLFLAPDLSHGCFQTLVSLATSFTRQLNLGYYACVHHVFITCKALLKALHRTGYRVTAYLPDCGKVIQEGRAIKVASFLFFKDLCVPKRPPRARSLVALAVNDRCHDVGRRRLLDVDILPVKVTCCNGRKAYVRNMATSEAATYYQWLQDAMNGGTGYGSDEFPTWLHFRHHWLKSQYSFVLQDAATNQLLAFFSLGTLTGVSRSASIPVADMNCVVAPAARRQQVSSTISLLGTALAKYLGFHYMCSSAEISNIASIKSFIRAGFHICGFLPMTMRIKDDDPHDAVMAFSDIRNFKALPELTQGNDGSYLLSPTSKL